MSAGNPAAKRQLPLGWISSYAVKDNNTVDINQTANITYCAMPTLLVVLMSPCAVKNNDTVDTN